MPAISIEILLAIVGSLGTVLGGLTSTDLSVKIIAALLKRFGFKFSDEISDLVLPALKGTRMRTTDQRWDANKLEFKNPHMQVAGEVEVTHAPSSGYVDARLEADRVREISQLLRIGSRPKFNQARNLLIQRMTEAEASARKNAIAAHILNFSSGALSITVIVIGAILTASIGKEFFSHKVVGWAGLAVAICSEINRRYSPGVGAQIAFQKTDMLRTLNKEYENKLSKLETEGDDTTDDASEVNKLTDKFFNASKAIEAISKKTHRSPS